jgi:predicted DNA-binding transcriptional regulator AlpA
VIATHSHPVQQAPTVEALPPLLTIAEVAGLLRVNPRTIRDWLDSVPEFPRPARIGVGRGVYRWRRSALLAWIAACEAAAE